MHHGNRNRPRGLPGAVPDQLYFRDRTQVAILGLAGGANRLYNLAPPQKKERRNHLMFFFLFSGRLLRRVFLVGLILGAIAVLIIFGFSLRRLIILGVILLGLRFILRAARHP